MRQSSVKLTARSNPRGILNRNIQISKNNGKIYENLFLYHAVVFSYRLSIEAKILPNSLKSAIINKKHSRMTIKMKNIRTKLVAIFVAIVLLLSVTTLIGCDSGVDSRSIVGAQINDNGELVLKYSDGSEENLGTVVGKNGEDGTDGEDGAPGIPGKNGADGKDGDNGKDGTMDVTVSISSTDTAIAAAVAKGLRSTVSIEAHHTKNEYNFFTGMTSTSNYTSEGSGVIYTLDDQNGSAYIITNHHVVYDSKSNAAGGISNNIKVYIYGSEYSGQSFPATYVGGSMTYDIAVLRVENCEALRSEFPFACEVADSNTIAVGETSIAIGNAEGLGICVTSGIISVDSESITMNMADGTATVSRRVIRIDTAVNHGNSGGPLFNDNGKLIGIVSAKLETSSVDNIGYAIPSNVACAVADNIIDNCANTTSKTVQLATLGVTVTPKNSEARLDTATGKITKIEQSEIVSTTPGSAADGKLLVGDILVSAELNGSCQPITRNYQLIDTMLEIRVSDTLTIVVLRDGVEVSVSVTFEADDISSVK